MGVPTWDVWDKLVAAVQGAGQHALGKSGRLTAADQLAMALMALRLNLSCRRLASMFVNDPKASSHISRTIKTVWYRLVASELYDRNVCFLPAAYIERVHSSDDFRRDLPGACIVADGTYHYTVRSCALLASRQSDDARVRCRLAARPRVTFVFLHHSC